MAKHRVMVVDDDPDIRFVVTSLLSTDFESTQAQNGLDALEKIDRHEPDFLLMDVSMPVMNGIACCHAITRNPEYENLPVIYLSARNDPDVKENALHAGGLAFVEKPFDTSKLISLIEENLKKRGIEPRAKKYTPEEISSLDAKPLESAEEEDEEQDELPVESQETAGSVGDSEPTAVPGKRRRIFGKRPKIKPAPDPLAEPDAPAEPEPAPETEQPPAPDYSRISKQLRKQTDEVRDRISKREVAKPDFSQPSKPQPKEEQPAESPADYERIQKPVDPDEAPKPLPPTEPIPDFEEKSTRPATPPAAHREFRPVAPPPARRKKTPAKPPEPSAAELLAQRRLGALGKKVNRGKSRPRVLVIINAQSELEIYHAALAGLAEFLPLEDPVEAVSLIARFQPDIVVMGIHERRFSGLQLAGMMSTNPRLSHIEILFTRGALVEANHLKAASRFSSNDIVRMPVTKERIRQAVEGVLSKPGFKVREKKLTYGVYVKEVINAANEIRRKENKMREKESIREGMRDLYKFMAHELKDYKEPEGYDELKGVGRKVHKVE